MIATIITKIFQLARSPILWAIFLSLIAIYLFANRERFTSPTSSAQEIAGQALEDLKQFDPKAAKILSEIEDKRQQRALRVAAHSAAGRDSRAVLAEMAKETAAVGGLPYRARLAGLALDGAPMTDEELEAFLYAHAMACQALDLAYGWAGASDYVTLLEEAHRNPSVWPLVKDDPLGLVIWSESDNIEALRFYHRNREWLADPLAALDFSETGQKAPVGQALSSLMPYEVSLKKAIVEGEIGIFGVAVMLTHGRLVESCRSRYGIHPAETISVIVMNPDILLEEERDNRWIGEMSSWLGQIEKNHPTVWFAAGMSPFALRLHRDAPHVSDSLLEKHGAAEIPIMIYRHFSETDKVAAAASAIDTFGDLAIYVFARYDDPAFIKKLGDYLTDDEIGIRIIPFILRFEDDAFLRIEDDKDWVDRYFTPDGAPRENNQDWMIVPGGAIVQVATAWAGGHPCEWSELRWAAFDVADIALVIATFGTSKAVTASAKVGAVAALTRTGGKAATTVTRATRAKEWTSLLKGFREATTSLARRMPRLARVSASIVATAKSLGKPIWGVYKLANSTFGIVRKGATRTLDAWKSLSPGARKWIYRGLLGASLYITITQRTLPNMDEIGKGIGRILGQAAAGTIVLMGEALVSSIKALVDSVTREAPWTQAVAYWILLLVLALTSVFLLVKGVRSVPRAKLALL